MARDSARAVSKLIGSGITVCVLAAGVFDARAQHAALRAEPRLAVHRSSPGCVGIYGHIETHAAGPTASARSAIKACELAIGTPAESLERCSEPGLTEGAVPLMGPGESPKFWYVVFEQRVGGLKVFDTRVGVLVRNEPGFPVAAVKAGVRPLGDWAPRPSDVEGVDPAKAFRAAMLMEPSLRRISAPTVGVWAGTSSEPCEPRLAVEFVADSVRAGDSEVDRRWFVADGMTGEILASGSRRFDADVTVTTKGLASQGIRSDTCENEVLSGLPHVGVSSNGVTYFTDDRGELLIPGPGGPTTLTSSLMGEHFAVDVYNSGADEVLTIPVSASDRADFVFNSANTTEDHRSAVNAYLSVSTAYAFVEEHTEGVVQSLCDGPLDVFVHRSNGAYFVGPTDFDDPCNTKGPPGAKAHLAFGASSAGKPSRAASTIVYHEYGHQLAWVGGARPGQASSYHEGMADVVAALVSDQPDLFIGTNGDCTTPLRSVDNDDTFPCASPDVHECGNVISGCFWDLWQLLRVSQPLEATSLTAQLALNSIPLHGNDPDIDPSVFLDVLALDSGDGWNPGPHWNEIQAAFQAHRMHLADFTGTGLQAGPVAFAFQTPPPELAAPSSQVRFGLQTQSLYGNDPEDGPAWIYTDYDGDGVFNERPLSREGTNAYTAFLPAPEHARQVRYYLKALTNTGREAFFPPGAPDRCMTLVGATTSAPNVVYRFDRGLDGWTMSPAGGWAVGSPTLGHIAGRPPVGPELQMTTLATTSGIPSSEDPPADFVIQSPAIDTTGCDGARLSFAWWCQSTSVNQSDDYGVCQVSYDNGSTWTTIEKLGAELGPRWHFRSLPLAPSANTRLRFVRHRVGPTCTCELSVDDVVVSRVRGCAADIDQDGFVTGDDMDVFVGAWIENNPCADVNQDAFVNGDDFDAFFDAFTYGC